jgi:hypothetical protein
MILFNMFRYIRIQSLGVVDFSFCSPAAMRAAVSLWYTDYWFQSFVSWCLNVMHKLYHMLVLRVHLQAHSGIMYSHSVWKRLYGLKYVLHSNIIRALLDNFKNDDHQGNSRVLLYNWFSNLSSTDYFIHQFQFVYFQSIIKNIKYLYAKDSDWYRYPTMHCIYIKIQAYIQ